jgi:hypothetical protein
MRKENIEIDYSERSARALHNGKYCEELIREKVPEIVESENVDGELFGSPLEIKSCQVQVFRSDKKTPRSGRFYLRDYQHSFLLENRGRYIFAVMNGEQIIHTKMILASRLLPEFTGCKTLTWKTLFNHVGEAC